MKTVLEVGIVLLVLLPGQAFAGNRLYYTNYKWVVSKDLPGGEAQVVHETSYEERPMWVKVHEGALYWSIYQGGQIWTSDLEGQNARVVVQQAWHAYTRNIEFLDGKMYWASEGLGAIYQSDPDGANVKEVVGGISYPDSPVDFAFYDSRLYWASWYGQMWSCTLNGGDLQPFHLPGSTGEVDAIEIENGTMYVAGNALYAYDMSDMSRYTLSTHPNTNGMDIFNGRIYYNDEFERKIYSCPLGGGPEVVEHEGNSWQLTVTGPFEVVIDIKPGSDPNSINLDAKGVLPVAIFGTGDFDVHDVDEYSLLLEGANPKEKGKDGFHVALEYINDDLFPDLIVQFSISELELEPGATEAELTGNLLDGTEFVGTDAVRLVRGFANPEPGTLSLLVIGGLAMLKRRRQ